MVYRLAPARGGLCAPNPGSKHLYSDGVYDIPFRTYSVNVENMLMAGRDISASHVAFGSTRVMATYAVIGEAAGTAAAVCCREKLSPRELSSSPNDLRRSCYGMMLL